MKKRKRLALDRKTIRALAPDESATAAGGWLWTWVACGSPTLNYDATCYSCNATWCNQMCSQWACSAPTS